MARAKNKNTGTNDNVVPLPKHTERMPPKNGEAFKIYSVQTKINNGEFIGVPRNKRQRGKIAEAQKFRRAQGAYLEARLHFRELVRGSQSPLRWWFSSTLREELHCRIMRQYYLYDAPTYVSDLLDKIPASTRNIMAEIKTATDLGSIELDALKSDKRKRVIYPTRGLVADTDNLFGRSTGETDGFFIFWGGLIDTHIGDNEDNERYRISDYRRDFDAYNDLITAIIPDTDREF